MPYKDPEKRRQHHATYMREVWYPANREKHIASVTNTKRKRRDRMDAIKLYRGCDSCGFNREAEALDWDHRPGETKCFDIAAGMSSRSWSAILEEMRKCDLLCAICHRIETKRRRRTK